MAALGLGRDDQSEERSLTLRQAPPFFEVWPRKSIRRRHYGTPYARERLDRL